MGALDAGAVVEGRCRHCGATLLFYPDDRQVAHRVPECAAYAADMQAHAAGPPMITAIDGDGAVIAMELFRL